MYTKVFVFCLKYKKKVTNPLFTYRNIAKYLKKFMSWLMVLGHKNYRTISVTQKPKIILHRISINTLPIVSDNGRNQKQQSTFGLMEIGYQSFDAADSVTGSNHNLGCCKKF